MSATPKIGMEAFSSIIGRLEKERKSRIWSIIHQGPLAHICGPTIRSVFNQRDSIGTGNRLEILLHSGGGHPDIAYRVMKLFRSRYKQVNVIVPAYAKSAATLMCLGASRIYMGEMAELGPIDIQIDDQVEHGQKAFSPLDEFKSLEFMREQATEWMDYYARVMNVQYGLSIKEALKDSIPLVSALMRPIFEQIDPVEMGGYRRAIAIGEEYAKRMLALANHPDTRELIQRTVWSYPSHDFCIDFDEAKALQLPVEVLSPRHEKLFNDAIVSIDREYFHGFAPPPPKPRVVRHPAKPKARRAKVQRPQPGPGPRPAERIGA